MAAQAEIEIRLEFRGSRMTTMFRGERGQEDMPKGLAVALLDQVHQFGQPAPVQQHAVGTSGMRTELTKARMHPAHMVKIRPMKFVAEIENYAPVVDETRGPQENCIRINRQHAVETLRYHLRKREFKQLLQVPSGPFFDAEHRANQFEVKRKPRFIDKVRTFDAGIVAGHDINISHPLDEAADRAGCKDRRIEVP